MNNLRRDIHSAFEVIEPPLGGMPERVVQTVLAEKNGRLRKEKMVYRLRISLALVAAVLVVAVGAAAVITWNSLHQANFAPAGGGVHTATLQQLEARPVDLPTIGPTAACPQNLGTNTLGFALGGGPVYADGNNPIPTAWGNYFDIPYFTSANLTGLVLIRGRDIRASTGSVVFVGQYAAGKVVGTDPDRAAGTQYSEAVLDVSHPHGVKVRGTYGWTVRQGLPQSASQCFGFQIDGSDFTERFTGGS